MIVLPTRRRLIRRRDALYDQLASSLQHSSVHQVEEIMRKVHSINLKLKTYFIRENAREPQEIFHDD